MRFEIKINISKQNEQMFIGEHNDVNFELLYEKGPLSSDPIYKVSASELSKLVKVIEHRFQDDYEKIMNSLKFIRVFKEEDNE